MTVHDPRPCELGEGPLWHPERGQLFWFDILGRRLLSREGDRPLEWRFDDHVSAAGWIDRESLLIASETGLWHFNIATGVRQRLATLEADRPETRTNDGRADPQGGFWIGTMGKRAEPGAGAIHRFFQGRVTPLFTGLTIPNAICFAPGGRLAYFTDSPTRRIMAQPLDADGWPVGTPDLFVDLTAETFAPDGAVVDAEGALWNAQWGAGRVARYLPDGRFDRALPVGGLHSSCPAFGGAGFSTLYVTTARENITAPGPLDGVLYRCDPGVAGQPEHRVAPG